MNARADLVLIFGEVLSARQLAHCSQKVQLFLQRKRFFLMRVVFKRHASFLFSDVKLYASFLFSDVKLYDFQIFLFSEQRSYFAVNIWSACFYFFHYVMAN